MLLFFYDWRSSSVAECGDLALLGAAEVILSHIHNVVQLQMFLLLENAVLNNERFSHSLRKFSFISVAAEHVTPVQTAFKATVRNKCSKGNVIR